MVSQNKLIYGSSSLDSGTGEVVRGRSTKEQAPPFNDGKKEIVRDKLTKEANLSLDSGRKEVIKDIYEETKNLHNFQRDIKSAFKEWLNKNIKSDKLTEAFNLVESFEAAFETSKDILNSLKELQFQLGLDERQKAQFEDFLRAFVALSNAFEILRDFEISNEEIQKELTELKAEILKPLEVKGEKLEDVLSEQSKLKLEKLVFTEEYQDFKNKFLSLEGVKRFLREEEKDLDFDKNDRYNVDYAKLVEEVVGYMVDLGVISTPEDLQRVFNEIKTVGGVFEYKEKGNIKVGKNALFVKINDKIITIRGNYGTTDIRVFRVGVDENLRKAASKLGISPQKLKELLNFDTPYGKIGQEKIGMEIKEGDKIEGKGTISSQVEISDTAREFLENLFDNKRAYNPEKGNYGLFRVNERGEVFITAPFIKVIENGEELQGDEKYRLYRDGLTNKKIELIVDPVLGNIKELRIGDSFDGKTKIEIFSYSPEKISYGGEKLLRNLENLPAEVVEFLNNRMEIDEGKRSVKIDGKEVPLGTKVILFKKDGNINYKLEKGELANAIEFDYQDTTQQVQGSGFDIYEAQNETASLQLPEELKNGMEINSEGVLIRLDSLSKVLGISLESITLDERLKVKDGNLVVPGHRGDLKILRGIDGIKITYEWGKYPLQLVYVDLKESVGDDEIVDTKRKYEILSPVKIESLDKLKDIEQFVEQNKLVLARLNMFDEYYQFIDSYKIQDWERAVYNLQKMLSSSKAKELGLNYDEGIMQKIMSLKDVDLIYALSLFVKGTLADEYLFGENLKGDKIDNDTVEQIGRNMLKIKQQGFIEHIKQNWGENLTEKLEEPVMRLSPKRIDISPSNRSKDLNIVASLVYTKREQEESFSLLPHGLGDVLEGEVVELNDVVLVRKILEKMPDVLLKNVLRNYGTDQYINLNALSRSEILELFIGKELIVNDTSIKIEGKPLYYLYGECINPTLGYRVDKVIITKLEEIRKQGRVEAEIRSKGYRLLQESTLTSASEGQRGRGWLYFKGRLYKEPSEIKKVGSVDVNVITKNSELNTIDVVPIQEVEWFYAIGGIDYVREIQEEPEQPTTRPTESPTEPPTPSPTPSPSPTPTPPEQPTTRPTDAPTAPPRPTPPPVDE